MAQTLAQKLVGRAAGRASVTPGEIVTCKVDLAMVHDSSGPRRLKPRLERGKIENRTIIRGGGLLPHLEKKLARKA